MRAPIERTVLTEVWTISGDRTSSAAATTASSERSLTTLNAATPYRSSKARSRISFSGTTGSEPSEVAGDAAGSGYVGDLRPPSGGSLPAPCGIPLPERALPAPQRGLGAVARAGLAQDRADVLLDRLHRDRQGVGDLAVGQPALQQTE